MACSRVVKTKFDRVVLCAGSMVDYITIEQRKLEELDSVDDNLSDMGFTLLGNFFSYIEHTKQTRRFDGVNTADQSGLSTTHVCYIPYDNDIFNLCDFNTVFIKLDIGLRVRNFKLKGVTNLGEQYEYLILHVDETGFTDQISSEG